MTEPWYRRWFNEDYRLVYSHRDEESSRGEVAFALEELKPPRNTRILDLCCGDGRHTLAIRERGFSETVSLDLSRELLTVAGRRLKHLHPEAVLVRGDMLHLPFQDRSFDLVMNFFTSFGYFETEEENLRVLQETSRILRPEGRLWLDYLNPPFIRKSLISRSERTVKEVRVIEEREIRNQDSRLLKTISVIRGPQTHIYRESVRLYEREEMEILLNKAGLSPVSEYGDYRNIPITEDTPRMILVARK